MIAANLESFAAKGMAAQCAVDKVLARASGVNGTFEDLCTFLCWSERTGRRRLKERAIAYRRQGRKILFWEDDVVRFASPQYVADRRLKPGEAQDLVRHEWRKHLALRKGRT